jgi:hypothetical protein
MSFSDYDDVKALIGLYIEGCSHGDAAKLTKAFHPRAYVMGHGEKLGFKGHFPADKYIEILQQSPNLAGPTYEAKIRSMDVCSDAGVVVLEEKNFHGHDFWNYLSVSKLEGSWCITNKTYTCTD